MVRFTRGQKIVTFAVVAALALVLTAYAASLSSPPVAAPNVAIADASLLQVDQGPANAVVFPFQLAPDSQADEDGAIAVNSASISFTLVVPACESSSAGGCSGVYVDVMTSDQLAAFPTQSNVTPLWCTNSSGGCTPSTGGTFGVDLTPYAGLPLEIVVWSPAGVEWANLSVHGTWT
jgi:hypothetical protein